MALKELAPKIEDKGNGILSLIIHEESRVFDLLEKIGNIIAQCCPPLRVTAQRFWSDPVTIFLDMKTWEEELRTKFADSSLRLARATGENGGWIRLLTINPVLSQQIQTRLNKLNIAHHVDRFQTGMPFSKLREFKKVLDELPAGKKPEKNNIKNPYLMKIQQAWTATLDNRSLNLEVMLPDGNQSRVSFELPLEEADCFSQVTLTHLHGLSMMNYGDGKFSVPVENLAELVSPERQLRIRQLLIETMVADLCAWNIQYSNKHLPQANNPVVSIEVVQQNEGAVAKLSHNNCSRLMDYPELRSYYARIKAQYRSPSPTATHCSNSVSSSIFDIGSPAFFGVSSAQLPASVPGWKEGAEEKKFARR